jgi:hypothetical protein
LLAQVAGNQCMKGLLQFCVSGETMTNSTRQRGDPL